MTAERRVLVVRTGAMGDVLHALPAVAALRQRWPGAVIDWAVDPRWAPLLVDEAGRGPVVSGVQLAETRLWSQAPVSARTVRSLLALRRALRAARYTHAVDVQGTLRSAGIARLGGAGRVSGFADPRERAAAWLYGRRIARRGEHAVEQNAALLSEALGVELEPVALVLPMRAEAERWAARTMDGWGGRVALLAPTAGWGAKQWPAARFGELAAALGATGYAVRVNAAGLGDPVAAEVERMSGGAARVVVGDVAELVATVRRVSVVVGGDTGPVHLAAALGVPVVALYGPTDPARNGPWGPGPKRVLRHPGSATSYKRTAAVEPGLARIEVGAVVEAVGEMLGQAAGRLF